MVGKLTPNDMITASLIPALEGLSPHTTRNELLAEMLRRDAGEAVDGFSGNEATGWGDRLEPVILREACHRLGIVEADIDLTEAFFFDKARLAASLDGMGKATRDFETFSAGGIYCPQNGAVKTAEGWGCLEAKLTSAAPEDAPPPWRGPLQLQAQMLCTGFSWGCIATLYRGIELRLFLYEADPDIQQQIIDSIDDFESRRVSGETYPIVSSEDGNHAFGKVDEDAQPIDLATMQGANQLVLALRDAKAKKAEAEAEINEAEAGIKELMGEHEEAFTTIGLTEYRVKWPMRRTRAQPEKVVPAKPETFKRQNTLTLKAIKSE